MIHDTISRRRLLGAAAAAAAAWTIRPWRVVPPDAHAQTPVDEIAVVPTLEAFADTLIPGEKRHPGDDAVAGAVEGPGAVHAGAVDLLHFPQAGVSNVLPAFVAGINAHATFYATTNGVVVSPVTPLVGLDFDQRTEVLLQMLDAGAQDRALWEALAALCFLAYHTAGHLPTAQAVRDGHPGLAAIGFPEPDGDDLWRFPEHSYGRPLARHHPGTVRGGHPS